MAPGDVWTYKFDEEVLFCIFFTHNNRSYFECLEKAFKTIKSQLTGYRYLGIQQDPIDYSYKMHNISRHLTLIKSVFSSHDAEIWICGDTSTHKSQVQQFQKVVNDAIEMNKVLPPKLPVQSRLKTAEKKYNSNGRSAHDSMEEISHDETYDIPKTLVRSVTFNTDDDSGKFMYIK